MVTQMDGNGYGNRERVRSKSRSKSRKLNIQRAVIKLNYKNNSMEHDTHDYIRRNQVRAQHVPKMLHFSNVVEDDDDIYDDDSIDPYWRETARMHRHNNNHNPNDTSHSKHKQNHNNNAKTITRFGK